MIYETERLTVRKWEAKDAEDLYEYVSDSEVMRFLTFPIYTNISQAHNRMEERQEHYKSGAIKDMDFAIELKETQKVIGSIGWVEYSEKAGGTIEIGYVLNPKFQRKGYMTEVLTGMFKYIKKNKLAMRITTKHDLRNGASGAVMKRAGMVFEGISRKSDDNNMGTRNDMAQYSILYEEINE